MMVFQGGLLPLKDRILDFATASLFSGSSSRAYGSSSIPLALLPGMIAKSQLTHVAPNQQDSSMTAAFGPNADLSDSTEIDTHAVITAGSVQSACALDQGSWTTDDSPLREQLKPFCI